jgi:hypothetical protein
LNVAASLLADENVPGAVVAALRQQGHDVAWIHEDAPGRPDPEVLERAQQEHRVVVTFDKDFGELAFRRGLAATRRPNTFTVDGRIVPDIVPVVVVRALEACAQRR